MRNKHVYILAAVLTLAGLAIFAYKTIVTGFPVLPGQQTQLWDIEARFLFDGSGGPVKVSTFVPLSHPGLRVQGQRFIAPGYGISVDENTQNRRIILSSRKAEPNQSVYLKFLIHRFATRETMALAVEPAPPRPKHDDATHAAVQALIETARSKSADLPTFVTALLKVLNAQYPDDNAAQILGRHSGTVVKADVAVAVLAVARIAARRVNGIDLAGPHKNTKLVRWIEVFDEGRWIGFSIDTGEANIPASYLAWWYGAEPLVTVQGGSRAKSTISFVRLQEKTLDTVLSEGRRTHSQIVTLSLFGLPLATQEVYRVLMVVPLGIFILVIIRNVIGLRSLGTFMPVLIALAFRETKLLWGIILFTGVVSAGLLFRAYVEHLKLLLVPRLASVLIFVVMFMAGLSVVAGQLGFQGGLSVALFPMVIMTMTIERVSVIWDELGAQTAMKQAFGSLAIAALCYLVMSHVVIEYLFFTFPELLLILLAGTMLLGRYTGYRLLELPRFKVLAGGGP